MGAGLRMEFRAMPAKSHRSGEVPRINLLRRRIVKPLRRIVAQRPGSQCLLEILGRRSQKGQWLACDGMIEGKLPGMQCLARHSSCRCPAIQGIGQQRVPSMCEVDTDLMRATRTEPAPEQATILALR